MRVSYLFGIGLLIAVPALAAAPADKGGAAAHAHHDHNRASAQRSLWTTYPVLLPLPAQRGDRSAAPFALENLRADAVSARSAEPTAPVGSFPVADGKAIVRTTARVGNYYWLQAQEESPTQVRVASTVRYFSNPGPSPRALLTLEKSTLEIIPKPLPREHAQYREGERWAFLVRFKNQALAGAQVTFESENGSKTTYTTDNDGLIAVDFPRDMKPEPPEHNGGHGAPKSAFVLGVEHSDAGKTYVTAFNYQYEGHAEKGKSKTAGVGFMVLGALLATPLLRRRKNDSGERKPS